MQHLDTFIIEPCSCNPSTRPSIIFHLSGFSSCREQRPGPPSTQLPLLDLLEAHQVAVVAHAECVLALSCCIKHKEFPEKYVVNLAGCCEGVLYEHATKAFDQFWLCWKPLFTPCPTHLEPRTATGMEIFSPGQHNT